MSRSRTAKLLSGAGLVAVGALVAGCGSTKIVTRTVTVPHTITRTVTRTQTVTRTVTSTPAATTTTSSTSSGKLTVIYRFSGNGSETLGTITIPASGATIAWENSGTIFAFQSQLDSSDQYINIDSQAANGESFVYAGTYPDVHVTAIGSWKVLIAVSG